MEYGWKGASKYLAVGARLLLVSLLQRFGVHAYELDDGTALRAFALTLAFEPVRSVAPIGWSCEHMTMTAGNGLITKPKCYAGCAMRPIFAPGDEPTLPHRLEAP
jgi:hypothetical protein